MVMSKQIRIVLAYVTTALFLVLAIIYFIAPANQLPTFLPGHDFSATKTHLNHGLAALLLALGSAAYGWFQTGPKLPQE